MSDRPLETIPERVLTDGIEKLGDDFRLFPRNWSAGWSCDWSKFGQLKHWLTPVLLWSDSEAIYDDLTVLSRLRNCHHLFGEPIPLLYDAKNPRVIFRIGAQLYLLTYEYYEEEIVEDIFKIRLPLERLLSGLVTEGEVRSALEALPRFNSRVDNSKDSYLRRYRLYLEFARKIGFFEAHGSRHLLSQDNWFELFKIYRDFLDYGNDPKTSTDRDMEEYITEIRSKVVKGTGVEFTH